MANKFNPLKIIQQTNKTHSGLVIFFHGSGDTGEGIRDWIKILRRKDLQFPHLKIIYPTAPLRPYTPLNGSLSNVWFDRLSISPDVSEHKISVDQVCNELVAFIKNELAAGVPLNRIIIGGFSMGGCLSLHLAYRFLPEVAGIFTLSSFLNNDSMVYNDISTASESDKRKQIPLFMCHGDRDDLVPIEWGENTYKNLEKYGMKGEFHPIKNMLHELKTNQVEMLNEWILKVLPPLESDN